MYGHGAFLRAQGFPCAILAEADGRTSESVDYSEKNFALIFSVGIFLPVQSSKAAAP